MRFCRSRLTAPDGACAWMGVFVRYHRSSLWIKAFSNPLSRHNSTSLTMDLRLLCLLIIVLIHMISRLMIPLALLSQPPRRRRRALLTSATAQLFFLSPFFWLFLFFFPPKPRFSRLSRPSGKTRLGKKKNQKPRAAAVGAIPVFKFACAAR